MANVQQIKTSELRYRRLFEAAQDSILILNAETDVNPYLIRMLEYSRDDLAVATLSVGVAVFPDHGQTRTGILRAAYTALYRAKQAGRNRVVMA